MVGIIVKRYEHFNKALGNWDTPKGKWISSKRQYNFECAKQGMIPYEQHKEQIKKEEERRLNESYNGLSRKAMSLIHSTIPDKRGNIHLSDRQIKALKEIGAKIDVDKSSKWLTSYDRSKGGFDNGA